MASISVAAGRRSRISELLGVERGEKTTLSLMVAFYFVVSISYVLVQTTAFGLFVNEFGSENLPYAYLSVAVLASAVAYGYLKFSERVSFRAAQYANLCFLAVGCLLFWWGLSSGYSHWVIFLLPFWFQALTNLANLIVWHAAGHLFDVRQAKRLFGLVAAGNWLANIVGGAVVASVLAMAGAANLYLMAALPLAAAALILRPILNSLSSRSISPRGQVSPRARRNAPPSGSPFRHPYSRLIFVYTLLWWLAFFVIDNIFFDRAGVEYPSGAQLASFLGQQLSVMGVIALITTSFLTSRIVGKYGVRTGLLVMPLVVVICAILLVIGGALGWSADALFWFAAAAKTLNVALGFSLSLAVSTLLYQPLVGPQRNATQTIAEGIVQPVAIGLAGVILLLFNTVLHFNAIGLSYLFLVIAAMWLWSIFRISDEYPKVLSEALKKRSLGDATNLLYDPAGLAQLQASLQNPRAAVALYALNQLEQLEPHAWQKTLLAAMPGLLAHPAAEVRGETLRRVLSLRLTEVLPLLHERLRRESAPQVYAVLIQVLAALGDVAAEPQVSDALRSSEKIVRYGAITGLLASGNKAQIARADESLRQLVNSARPEDRILAAEILAEHSDPASETLLAKLLEDAEVPVQKAAILAVRKANNSELLDKLCYACDSLETAPIAARILTEKGAASIPAISRALAGRDMRPIPPQRLQSLVRVLGNIRDERAVDLLRSRMREADPEIGLQVFRSLSAQGFRARPADGLDLQLKDEIASAAWIAAALRCVEEADGQSPLKVLKAALESAFASARSRLLLLLSFAYDSRAMLRAERTLREPSASQAAFAAETVDALLPARLKRFVLPLIENAAYERRLAQLRAAGLRVPVPGLPDLLTEVMGARSGARFSAWTRMCAIHAAGMLGIKACAPALKGSGSAADPRVIEMSRWSLAHLRRGGAAQGEDEMLSLVEKVLILKSANIFGETPDNVLADIAGLAEEVRVDKDQLVFNKGDAGDSMYVIVTGAVEVCDDGRLLNRLGEGDFFGELALLDPEPRLASVTALEATHLLRLDESDFRVILAERPEVSSAIIRVITRYLRSVLRGAGHVESNLSPSKTLTPLAGIPAA